MLELPDCNVFFSPYAIVFKYIMLYAMFIIYIQLYCLIMVQFPLFSCILNILFYNEIFDFYNFLQAMLKGHRVFLTIMTACKHPFVQHESACHS